MSKTYRKSDGDLFDFVIKPKIYIFFLRSFSQFINIVTS